MTLSSLRQHLLRRRRRRLCRGQPAAL